MRKRAGSKPIFIYELSDRLNVGSTLDGWGDRYPEHSKALRCLVDSGVDAVAQEHFTKHGVSKRTVDYLVKCGALIRVRLEAPEENTTSFLRLVHGGIA